MNVKRALSKLPSYSEELGLDLSKAEDRFRWFMASILFAKRISARTAKKTYLHFEKEGLTNPDAILEAGWDRLVKVLDSGGYTRYDYSTATNLLVIAKTLKEKYSDLESLHEESRSSIDLENRLQEFKGVGKAKDQAMFMTASGDMGVLKGFALSKMAQNKPMAVSLWQFMTTSEKLGWMNDIIAVASYEPIDAMWMELNLTVYEWK